MYHFILAFCATLLKAFGDVQCVQILCTSLCFVLLYVSQEPLSDLDHFTCLSYFGFPFLLMWPVGCIHFLDHGCLNNLTSNYWTTLITHYISYFLNYQLIKFINYLCKKNKHFSFKRTLYDLSLMCSVHMPTDHALCSMLGCRRTWTVSP